MVVQKTLDNLKDRPHDEKKAVASGIAIAVVVILIIGWGFLFLRKVRNTNPSLESGAVPEDQFNLDLIRDTERNLSNTYENASDDLRNMRDTAAQNNANVQAEYSQDTNPVAPDTADQFGTQGGDF